MSALLAHAQAAEMMADAFGDEFVAQTDEQIAIVCGVLSAGYRAAAGKMRAQIRDEARAMIAQPRGPRPRNKPDAG